eukprot:6153470-Prymnesium_polylepis.2
MPFFCRWLDRGSWKSEGAACPLETDGKQQNTLNTQYNRMTVTVPALSAIPAFRALRQKRLLELGRWGTAPPPAFSQKPESDLSVSVTRAHGPRCAPPLHRTCTRTRDNRLSRTTAVRQSCVRALYGAVHAGTRAHGRRTPAPSSIVLRAAPATGARSSAATGPALGARVAPPPPLQCIAT